MNLYKGVYCMSNMGIIFSNDEFCDYGIKFMHYKERCEEERKGNMAYIVDEDIKLSDMVKGFDDENSSDKIPSLEEIDNDFVFHRYKGPSKKHDKKAYKRKNKIIKKSRKNNRRRG